MNAGNLPSLDQLDIRIMEEFESDATQSYTVVATKLEVSRSTLMGRVQQLLHSGTIRKFCLVAPIALGYKFEVTFAIVAEPRLVSDVARRLAAFASVQHVDLCTGSFDITAWGLFREKEDLTDFLLNKLGTIQGIQRVDKMVTLEVVKRTTRLLRYQTPYPENPAKDPVNLDDLDAKLIEELQVNARQKTGRLARKLGVSKPTIVRRSQRLMDEGVIQIITVINPFSLGYEGIATIGLKCNPDKVKEVAKTVASFKEVQYVGIYAGRYDILIWVMFRKLRDLRYFTTDELGSIPGLKDTETMINHRLVKLLDLLPVHKPAR